MNKFILMIPACPEETERAAHQFVIGRAGWWHYGHDVWIFRTSTDSRTDAMRDELSNILPGVSFMLAGVGESELLGMGPPEWTKWFNEVWHGESQ
jgi:hypothetical protein